MNTENVKNEANAERIITVTAKVMKVTAELKPVYVYDDDEDRWVAKRDEDGKVIYRKIVGLHLNKQVHTILDAAHNFEDVLTDTVEFSRHTLQRVIAEADNKVSRKIVKLYEKTEMTELSLSAVMAVLENAVITMRVITRLPGDKYYIDGEEKTVEHKNYFYDIIDIEIADEAYDDFNDEVAEQIVDWKEAQREAKAMEAQKIAADAAARATVLNSQAAPF